MTTTDIKPLTDRTAGLLIGIRHLLNRPNNTQAADGASYVIAHPAGDELRKTAIDLEQYAGPALAAPILQAAHRAANIIDHYATAERETDRALSAAHADQSLAAELLTQAADVLDELGDAYVTATLGRIIAEARFEVLADVVDQRADLGTSARRAGILREANKRADRLARQRCAAALGLPSDAGRPRVLADLSIEELIAGTATPDEVDPE